MRRDLDLLRAMVLKIEDSPQGWAPQDLAVDGYSPDELGYHSYLLVDAGLAHGSDTSCAGSEGPSALITHLTWSGHEFAEAARNDTLWNKAMGLVKSKGGAITLPVLTQLLSFYMKTYFGLP
jgi:hypothetical protein